MTLYRRLLLQSFRRFLSPTSTASFTTSAEQVKSAAILPVQPPPRTLGFVKITEDPQDKAKRLRRRRRGFKLLDYALKLHQHVQSVIYGGDLDVASAILKKEVLSNTNPHFVQICNSVNLVMDAMYRAGRHEDVVALFSFFFKQKPTMKMTPNAYSYNVLINTHCDAGRVDEALQVYNDMLSSVDNETYRHLTKGLVSANRISDAMNLRCEMLHRGLGPDTLVYNNLISGFLELNDVEGANNLFYELLNVQDSGRQVFNDGVVYATYIDYYFKHNMEKEAMELYQSLLDRQLEMAPKTNNVLLEVLLKHGKSVEANALFEHMLNSSSEELNSYYLYNSDSYNIMVNEFFRLGKVSEALLVFKKKGTYEMGKPFVMDAVGYNNIIGKLCELGMVAEAENLFEEIISSKPLLVNATTFRIIFDAYFKQERMDDVLKWFNYLLYETNLKPSRALVNSVFSRVINKGRIEEAVVILGKMQKRDQKPFPTSYELVLSELCRGGKLDPVWDLLGVMVRYNIGITPALLGIVYEAFGKQEMTHRIEGLFGGRLKQVKEVYDMQEVFKVDSLYQERMWFAKFTNTTSHESNGLAAC